MSIPYNDHLAWSSFRADPNWYKSQPAPSVDRQDQVKHAVNELYAQTINQPVSRGVQFIRDAARLVLKVPIRSVLTPIFLKKNWKERERAKINAKLTGYSFVQLVSVPAKFVVALTALATSKFSQDRAKWLLDKSEDWTAHLDGRASQLEALKEEGRIHAKNRGEFNNYKKWLYSIDPKICRKDR
jgi:hypothetical protein